MKIYKELKGFITSKMRMSHVYQPVMLIALLQNKGQCAEADIAKHLLSYDQSQIDYYTKITGNMVGRVLRNHKIVERDRESKSYSLNDFGLLSGEQIDELVGLCEEKIADFLDSRGDGVFAHRRKSSGYISGTIRYEVLKRAKFRCELCGISAEEKALEVDHIIPRNKCGSDDLSNLQALCYSCNAMKRDRDDTDFRGLAESYKHREEGCDFCELPETRIITENELCVVVRDMYPVTDGHTLLIPKRHVQDYFELGQAEVNAVQQLLSWVRADLESADSSINGFNVGVNVGESAGQTVMHCHIHVFPRRSGDIEQRVGGVRNIFAGKGEY